MADLLSANEKRVLSIKLTYWPQLEAATTFAEYKRLQLNMERQILAVYGLEHGHSN